MPVRLKINRHNKIDFEAAGKTAAAAEGVEASADATSGITALFSAEETLSEISRRNSGRREKQVREGEFQRHPRIQAVSAGFY